MDEICSHMENGGFLIKEMGYWTAETIAEDAAKYDEVSEWRKNSSTPYAKASELGIYMEVTAHMTRKPNGPEAGYTFEEKGWSEEKRKATWGQHQKGEKHWNWQGGISSDNKKYYAKLKAEGKKPLAADLSEEERELKNKEEREMYAERRYLKRKGIIPLNSKGVPGKKTCRELYDKDGNLAPEEKWEELLVREPRKRFDVPRMRRQFLSSDITLRALAQQHGCSYSYVSLLSSQERWFSQRQKLKPQFKNEN
jgi:hypothetical protein